MDHANHVLTKQDRNTGVSLFGKYLVLLGTRNRRFIPPKVGGILKNGIPVVPTKNAVAWLPFPRTKRSWIQSFAVKAL